MIIDELRSLYYHRRGHRSSNDKQVVGTWWFTTSNLNGRFCTIPFNSADGKYQILLYLEVVRHSVTNHIGQNKIIAFVRPSIDN